MLDYILAATTAPNQEGTSHLVAGRSSDSPLFQSLVTFSSDLGTMVFQKSDECNFEVASGTQRPVRPGISPEFPVHPIRERGLDHQQRGGLYRTRQLCQDSRVAGTELVVWQALSIAKGVGAVSVH